MDFGIGKCVTLKMKRGKREIMAIIELRNQEIIRMPKDKEDYKFIGILEAEICKENVDEKKKKRK